MYTHISTRLTCFTYCITYGAKSSGAYFSTNHYVVHTDSDASLTRSDVKQNVSSINLICKNIYIKTMHLVLCVPYINNFFATSTTTNLYE